MPIGVLEMNPAIPHAALSTTSLSGSLASYLLLRNSLAEPLFRLLRKLFHGELPQIGSLGFMRLMIPQAGDIFELFGTFPKRLVQAVIPRRRLPDILRPERQKHNRDYRRPPSQRCVSLAFRRRSYPTVCKRRNRRRRKTHLFKKQIRKGGPPEKKTKSNPYGAKLAPAAPNQLQARPSLRGLQGWGFWWVLQAKAKGKTTRISKVLIGSAPTVLRRT